MKHYVFLTTLPYYKVYMQMLEKQVDADSRYFVTSSNFRSFAGVFDSSPFFSDNYVVTVVISEKNEEYLNTVVKWSQHPWVQIAFHVGYMENFRTLVEKLKVKKVDFVAVNCYQIPDKHKQLYIQQEALRRTGGKTKLSLDTCKMIISRAKGTEAQLDNYLTTLMAIGFDKRTIYNTIKPVESVRLAELPMTILLGEKPTLCAKTVYKYRYSGKLLLGTFGDFFEIWEKVYGEYRAGRFTSTNYVKWVSENGKAFKIHSEYMALRWLELFRRYSFGYMYQLQKEFKELKGYDWFSVFTKIYGMTGVF